MREGEWWSLWIGCTLVDSQWKNSFLDPTVFDPADSFLFSAHIFCGQDFQFPIFQPGCPLDSSPTSRPPKREWILFLRWTVFRAVCSWIRLPCGFLNSIGLSAGRSRSEGPFFRSVHSAKGFARTVHRRLVFPLPRVACSWFPVCPSVSCWYSRRCLVAVRSGDRVSKRFGFWFIAQASPFVGAFSDLLRSLHVSPVRLYFHVPGVLPPVENSIIASAPSFWHQLHFSPGTQFVPDISFGAFEVSVRCCPQSVLVFSHARSV
jgi:hypothetical protein